MADKSSEQDLHIIQSMIDLSSERLEGLRTKCSTTAELTQQEIRTLEVNLPQLILIKYTNFVTVNLMIF